MGLSMSNEMMQWLDISLLGIIALFLLILIGLAGRVIALLKELKDIKSATDYQSAAPACRDEEASVFEEDLAVIMAIMAQKYPALKDAAIQVRPVKMD